MSHSFTEMEIEVDFCFLSTFFYLIIRLQTQMIPETGLIFPVYPQDVKYIIGAKYTLAD